MISDLEQRRDAVLAELERLASGIAGHRDRAPGAGGRRSRGEPDDAGRRRGREDTDETTVLARDAD